MCIAEKLFADLACGGESAMPLDAATTLE